MLHCLAKLLFRNSVFPALALPSSSTQHERAGTCFPQIEKNEEDLVPQVTCSEETAQVDVPNT